ncbi:MAG: SDR family oxidoreductase [Desulfohalobiaceae bacterium]|nr:SDR family oxidoreductase [Desulfohalobiaceae bacterium]
MDFSKKRVLITGGSRGIGRACSLAFAERGARVVVNFRQGREAAQQTLEQLPGGPHALIQADIADPDAVRGMVDQAGEELGGLDIVVNNAGISLLHPIEDLDYEQWQEAWNRTLSINLLGPANVMYCAARFMKHNRGGRIVNVSSRGAFRGEPEQPAYGASKAGLNALSQSLAARLAQDKIFIGVVAPGFVETDMSFSKLEGAAGNLIRQQSPLGRVARPEEVAFAVLFLAAEGSEFTTGAILDVNGASYLRS